jgi:hypothetical protein
MNELGDLGVVGATRKAHTSLFTIYMILSLRSGRETKKDHST